IDVIHQYINATHTHSYMFCLFVYRTPNNVLVSCFAIVLTSSPAQLKPPGDSVKLSCQVSGYALTDHGTAWIRHQPGKTLEWIGIIWGGGSIKSGASFKSRFTISRDNSNVLYLDITSLQAEDTAVYYCAKTGGTVQQLTCSKTSYILLFNKYTASWTYVFSV
uniref:Immunoglobulin heavy variable 13-2 n=1 Tax=Salmo trutta TaxID=8032 RepID=A0A674EHA8_SALTR